MSDFCKHGINEKVPCPWCAPSNHSYVGSIEEAAKLIADIAEGRNVVAEKKPQSIA